MNFFKGLINGFFGPLAIIFMIALLAKLYAFLTENWLAVTNFVFVVGGILAAIILPYLHFIGFFNRPVPAPEDERKRQPLFTLAELARMRARAGGGAADTPSDGRRKDPAPATVTPETGDELVGYNEKGDVVLRYKSHFDRTRPKGSG